MGTLELAYTNRKLIVAIGDSEVVSNMADAVRNALGGGQWLWRRHDGFAD